MGAMTVIGILERETLENLRVTFRERNQPRFDTLRVHERTRCRYLVWLVRGLREVEATLVPKSS